MAHPGGDGQRLSVAVKRCLEPSAGIAAVTILITLNRTLRNYPHPERTIA